MMVPIIRYCALNEGVIPADGTVVAEGLVVILLGVNIFNGEILWVLFILNGGVLRVIH